MPEQRSRGFTLVEIVVVMALLGLIAAVITGVVAVVVRTTDPTESRADESRSIRGLTTWMAQDVAAATPGPTGFDLTPSAAPSCTGVVGDRLFKLTWTETTSATREYIADYRLVDLGPGVREVRRFACSGALGGAPFSGGTSNRLTGPIGANAPIVDPITDGVSTIGVALTVWTADPTPEPMRVEASTRNPAAALPIVPTTATTIASATTTGAPPTTTGTTCAISGHSWPDDIERDDEDDLLSPLKNHVDIRFTVNSACTSPMRIEFDRGDGAGVQSLTLNVGPGPNGRRVRINDVETELWTTGPKVLTVFHGATALAPTYTLDID